tara:strand:+ start:658 stop:846 length:189 start_codon:yes stop_codon:yes gene_type:complete
MQARVKNNKIVWPKSGWSINRKDTIRKAIIGMNPNILLSSSLDLAKNQDDKTIIAGLINSEG